MGVAFLVAGLALGPAPALAQEANSSTNTPAADSIGPSELQDFSLQGTVTRSADPPPAATPAPSRPRPAPPQAAAEDRSAPTVQPARPAERQAQAEISADLPAPVATARAAPSSAAPQRSSITVDLPPVGGAVTQTAAAAGFDQPSDLAPEHGFSLWPWLLAALALGAGAAFLYYRRNHRELFAGAPQVDAFVAPQPPVRTPKPVPAPRPAPAPGSRRPAPVAAPRPAPPAAPEPSGIVSTRLRPWIDLEFEPLRCIVEDEQVRFEFELSMANSGSAPARDVLIEASTFNAGPTQEQEIRAFFEAPVGTGDRIAAIPPLKNFSLRTQVTVARNQVRVLEAGGRHVFVPLIAFNAVYRWGTGDGQTSAAYLLGRDNKGEKMAPFRLDLGARIFRGVGKRALPEAVRR